MRILGGKYKGQHITAPILDATRPTTDKAKESLFTLIENKIELEGKRALDLFCGTGALTFELVSRGVSDIFSVDTNPKALAFIREQAQKWDAPVKVVKSDVYRFLKLDRNTYDIIIADPPYNNQFIKEIPEYVFSKQMLNKNGILIVEHGREVKLNYHSHFVEERDYGRVHFSFFSQK